MPGFAGAQLPDPFRECRDPTLKRGEKSDEAVSFLIIGMPDNDCPEMD